MTYPPTAPLEALQKLLSMGMEVLIGGAIKGIRVPVVRKYPSVANKRRQHVTVLEPVHNTGVSISLVLEGNPGSR